MTLVMAAVMNNEKKLPEVFILLKKLYVFSILVMSDIKNIFILFTGL
jgi:hypothetical protein